MKIPLVDLRAAHAPIQEALAGELDATFDNMQLLLGPNVQAFEREFAAYCAAAHGIGVSSGTDALFAALRACGVGPGDEVIAPSLTFFATIGAIDRVPIGQTVEIDFTLFNPEATEAIDLDVEAPVIALSLMRRIDSRDPYDYSDRLLSAMRNQFGGHAVKKAD